MVRRLSRDVQLDGSEMTTWQRMIGVINNWIDHQPFLTGEYRTVWGTHGCETSLPPPSTENKICKKFQDKIKQLKENPKRKELNDDFVKAFLESNPTESVLIPTEEIRFGRFFNQPRFQGRSQSRWTTTKPIVFPPSQDHMDGALLARWNPFLDLGCVKTFPILFCFSSARGQKGWEWILPKRKIWLYQKPRGSRLAQCHQGTIMILLKIYIHV